MKLSDFDYHLPKEFIAQRTEGFESFQQELLRLDIDQMEKVSGIDRNLVKKAAIAYASAPNAMSN